MKLDMDCVRDVLLEVEAKSGFCRFVSFPSGFDQDIRNRYSDDALRYHIDQCFSSGLLVALDPVHPWDMAMITTIKDLSPAGHEFLSNIRQDSLWNKTKSVAASVGSFSIRALADIAASVVSAAVQAHLNS